MKKNYLLIVLSLLFFQLFAFGQGNIHEEVLLVTNKNQFLTGENIYFQGFVTSSKTGKRSSLSSLIYIELLDENQNPIYQTKIALDRGLIAGNLFISTLIKSGNYDLVLIEAEKVTPSKAVGNAKNYDSFIIEVYVKDGNSTVTPAAIVTEVEKLK